MAFESLSEKLSNTFKKLRGQGVLTEKNVTDALREIKLALLEADVNFLVVKDFIAKVKERALGTEVMKSLTPGQQMIKIVHEELITLLGDEEGSALRYGDVSPSVFMLVGLQGAGKTTMAAKLALYLKKKSKKPMLVACDVYRPAAIRQLEILGEKAGIPVFQMGAEVPPCEIFAAAVEKARRSDVNLLIVDTAGRQQIDEALMEELEQLKAAARPSEILLAVDAMTGQNAVEVARGFNERLGITGAVLTKLDGDSRGGAALSVRAVTGVPIKFAGVGEKLEDIELFHGDRMAGRILGMGDVLTAIEKAQEAIDEEEARKLSQRMFSKDFSLDDYLTSIRQMNKMGGISAMMGMLPAAGMGKIDPASVDEEAAARTLRRTEAMILSMTPAERRKPQLLDASRKRRIVRGSGTTVQELNVLLKQFEQMKTLMKQFGGNKKNMGRMLGGLGRGFRF